VTAAPPRASDAAGLLLTRQLERHARLRWFGVVLLWLALPGVALFASRIALGTAPLGQAFLCFGGVMAPLSAFGTNNDTAVFAMRELARRRALPPAFQAELARERQVRAERLADAHASPKAAIVLPMVAIAVVSFLYYRAGFSG